MAKLNAIVKRAHWIICGQECKDKCLPDFSARCNSIANNLFYSITINKSHILHDLLPQKSIRTNRFILPHINNNAYLNSFIIHGAMFHNSKCENR